MPVAAAETAAVGELFAGRAGPSVVVAVVLSVVDHVPVVVASVAGHVRAVVAANVQQLGGKHPPVPCSACRSCW